jgi:hypothetical protein
VLRRCTLRKYAASSTQMAADQRGAAHLGKRAKLTLEQCYVEVGMGCRHRPALPLDASVHHLCETLQMFSGEGALWSPPSSLHQERRSGNASSVILQPNCTVLDPICVTHLLPEQGGLGGLAADVSSGACLTCKDSVLVSWGGALEGEVISCPVLMAQHSGSTLSVQGCTVQLHPDSSHLKTPILLRAMEHGNIRASGCKLVGPAPGSAPGKIVAAEADTHGVIALVSAAAYVDILCNRPTEPLSFRDAGRICSPVAGGSTRC